MDSKKEKLLNKAYTSFVDLMLNSNSDPVDHLDRFAAEDVMGYGSTLDEKIHDLKELKGLAILQREQSAGMKLKYELIPVFRKISNEGNTAVIVDEITITMQIDGEDIVLNLRLSTVMEFAEGNWKVVHWHGSKPDYDSGGTDTWHKEELHQKQAELEKQVKEKTAELVKQNRELEVEAALERVRTVAMGMQKPNDLLDVCEIISEQLETLNVKNIRNIQVAIIDDEKKNYANYQYFTAYSKKVFEEPVYGANPSADAMVREMRKSANSFFIGSIKGEELNMFNEWRINGNQFPDPILDKSDVVYYCFYSIGKGGLGLTTYKEISSESLEIFKRFHNVFTLAYHRFVDIRKAVGQAREAEIQLALERVRARTMAMQNSSELGEVAVLLFEQIKQLGIEPYTSGFNVWGETHKTLISWMSNPTGSINPPFEMPIHSYEQHNRIYKAWKKKEVFLENDLHGESMKKYYRFLRSFPLLDEAFNKSEAAGIKTPKRQVHNIALFSHGYLLFITLEPHPEFKDIFIRFAKVFEQTYTRFLDLKKAEKQARKAQIEAALERVRSRSMAMHKSEELADLSFELVKQVHSLGIETWFCAFNIWDGHPKGSLEWGSNAQGTYEAYRTPREGIFQKYYEAGQKGETLLVNEIDENECPAHYDYLCSLPGVGEQLIAMKEAGLSFPTSQIDHVAFFKYGYIIFITFKPVPEAHDIFKRFANEFEQTYTRFLDLKKSEEQAREAQIEAALENVRSRSLAMHTANELGDVVTVIVEKLLDLGVVLDANGVVLCTYFQESKDVLHWIASPDFSFAGSYLLPYFDHPIFNDAWSSKQSGDAYFSKAYSIEEKNSFFEYAFKYSDYKHFPDDFKQWVFQNDQHILSFAWQKNSAILIPSHTGVVPSEDEVVILKRFAKVFEQAYVRFMDLQKAEAQAREAQIEAALERVRSRSMAMHSSSELVEASDVMLEELNKLNINAFRIGICTINKDTEASELWSRSEIKGKAEKPILGVVPKNVHPVFDNMVKAWKENKSIFSSTRKGDEVKEYYQKLSTYLSYPLPETFNEQETISAFFFREGSLNVLSKELLQKDEEEIMLRFAKVFEQTYTRFLDLKKAEEQATEAVKQASLDRVRGEIASMRNSKDLNRITPVIWHELQALEVPFIRCGIFIMNNGREKIQTYLSTPDGQSLSAFELDYNAEGIASEAFKHWRENEIYKDFWDKKQFVSFMQGLIDDKKINNPDKFMGNASPPESLNLHFVPFKQGMLYVGDTSPLADEKIKLVKTLAEAFSIAYARYEDFKNLEDAKNKIERTLTELKAAQKQLIQSEKMASLGELTAGIAHEIQNPLNFVNNFSELSNELLEELKEEIELGNNDEVKAITDDVIQNLQKINHHGKRAEGIIKGMLLHSRGSTGQKEPTDLNKLADEYLRLSYHGLRAKDKSFNADFKIEADESLPKLNVVPQDIGRVLLNLINNAFYAVNDKLKQNSKDYKPTVVVKTKLLDKNIEIVVKDNGSGIPESVKSKIFQPFFTTKPTGQGTGLGLSMSYDIITKGHDGELSVESIEKQGTSFIITLPNQ